MSTLKAATDITSGIGFPKEYQGLTAGDLGFFKVGDISRAVIGHRGDLQDAEHYVSFQTAEKLRGKPVPTGATVFAKIGEAIRLNRRAIVIHPCLVDNNVMAVKARFPISDRYLFYYMRTLDLAELSRATTVPSLRKSDIEAIEFPLASLPEQKRIADKLDVLLTRVDACRERLARVPHILKRFRQSVLAAAISGELTREWREERNRQFDWTETTVGELITGIEAGLNVKCKERPPADDEKGLVKISAVTWGRYDDDESKTLPTGATVSETTRIRVGDFLISRANTLELVGACVLVHKVTRPVYLSDKVLRLVLPDEWKEWLIYALRSPYGRIQIESRASGNQLSMRNLPQARLREISVPIPPADERDEIVRQVAGYFSLTDVLAVRLTTAMNAVSSLTPAVLAKAFRGELVPQDPDDEPASALLARIRAARAAAEKEKPKRGCGRRVSRSPKFKTA